MAAKRVDYYSWFLCVIAWDAMLPVAVVLIPFLVDWLFPNKKVAVEISEFLLPLSGFSIRLIIGYRHISKNACGEWLSFFQFCVFFIGIFCLIVIDLMLILHHTLHAALVAKEFGIVYSIYLSAMIFAMYPGATENNPPAKESVQQYYWEQ